MLLDCENGARRGVIRVIHHYTEASNKYMHDYDKSKESTYVLDPDFKNQYGYLYHKNFLMAGKKLLKMYQCL